MPSVALSTQWFCRITLPHSILKEKIHQVLSWIDLVNILCLLHTGDKTEKEHCHFTISLASKIQKQSFDKRIKAIFDVKGSDYSSKPWDGGTSANSYMFHQYIDNDSSIIANSGYSESDISDFIALNEQVQKVVAINNQRGTGKVIQSVIASWTGTPDKLEIGKILLTKIRDGEMYEPGNYKLAMIVEEIFMKIIPEEWWDDYCNVRISQLKI